jgi:hypothetical protein
MWFLALLASAILLALKLAKIAAIGWLVVFAPVLVALAVSLFLLLLVALFGVALFVR